MGCRPGEWNRRAGAGRSPGSRISASPRAFPPPAGVVAIVGVRLPGDSCGTAPESHRVPCAVGGIIRPSGRLADAIGDSRGTEWLGLVPGVTEVVTTATGSHIQVSSREATGVVLQRLVASDVHTIRTSMPSLEEVYVHVFGDRGLRIE